jgi:hypothetical protein
VAQTTVTGGSYCWGLAVPPYGSDNASGYDRYGNLVKTDAIQTCHAVPTLNLNINANNQFTAYSYDESGNMLNDGSANSYSWSAEGLLKSTGTVNYTYDGDGKRVEKSTGTYYWFSPGGIVLAETDTSGNTLNEYIYFDGAPNNLCNGLVTNRLGVTEYYQYWAFAGLASVADGYYPGVGPLNPYALATELSLAYEQWVRTNPGLEIGGQIDTPNGPYVGCP